MTRTSWAYAGRWETKATQVDVNASDPELVVRGPQTVAPAGPMLLTLKDAATLTLWFSDLRKSGKGEVIYTLRKFVKKAIFFSKFCGKRFFSPKLVI